MVLWMQVLRMACVQSSLQTIDVVFTFPDLESTAYTAGAMPRLKTGSQSLPISPLHVASEA